MEFAGVFFGGFITLALLGNHMQKRGTVGLKTHAQRALERGDIVTGINVLGYPYRYYTMVRITAGKGEGWIKPRKYAPESRGVPPD